MKLAYPAIFEPLDSQEGYCVSVPDLPGCVTQGRDTASAYYMAVDAASGWVLDELEDGKPAPEPSNIRNFSSQDKNGFVSLIVLDMDSYAEKYGNKAVRKNLTIPAWLAIAADSANVNYSQILQEALKEKLHI